MINISRDFYFLFFFRIDRFVSHSDFTHATIPLLIVSPSLRLHNCVYCGLVADCSLPSYAQSVALAWAAN